MCRVRDSEGKHNAKNSNKEMHMWRNKSIAETGTRAVVVDFHLLSRNVCQRFDVEARVVHCWV